jgi:hypothetical protein
MLVIETPMRSWVAEFRWPGKKKFMVGTVVIPNDVMQHELEIALTKKFEELWGDILPYDVSRPQLINAIPGAIFFTAEQVSP